MKTIHILSNPILSSNLIIYENNIDNYQPPIGRITRRNYIIVMLSMSE